MNRIIIIALLSFLYYYLPGTIALRKTDTAKKECYGFKPTSFSEQEKEAKSAKLDKFWDLAKTEPDKALPCLKDMIMSENNDPYFCFDAASLILSLDKKEQYLDAVLEGVKKADLHDLQLESYLQVCYFLGRKGKDITLPTEKLISEPGAHVYLTVHVIDLSAIDASLFLYNTMSTQAAERSLISTITNGNPTGKHNAAVILNLLSTARGDSLLNQLMAKNELADSTKKFILKDREAFVKNTKTRLTAKDEAKVRLERQETITAVSDESLSRFFELTGVLITIRNKQ